MRKLVILGAGGYGRTVLDIAEQLGYESIVLDDSISGSELSTFTSYIDSDTEFIPAFGNNAFRMDWIDKIEAAEGKLATIIHPTAYVSPKASISAGSVILPKAVVNTEVTIGRGCIINIGSLVDHGCVIEDGVHLAPGAIVKGENRIERLKKIDSGEAIEARAFPV